MEIDFHQSRATPKPVSAFILYAEEASYSDNASPVFATINPIAHIDGVPTIEAGRPINEADILKMLKGITGSSSLTHWVDPSILASGGGRLIWFTPPQSRPLFFDTSDHVKPAIKAQGCMALPGMVWLAWGDDLYVYATACKDRPAEDEQLFQAPLFNVWGRGKVCWGNTAPPTADQMANPKAWEQRLFGSAFTHPNFTEKDRLIKGNPAAYWASQARKPRKTFPVDLLVPVALKLSDLLTPELSTKLTAIPKPKGEF